MPGIELPLSKWQVSVLTRAVPWNNGKQEWTCQNKGRGRKGQGMPCEMNVKTHDRNKSEQLPHSPLVETDSTNPYKTSRLGQPISPGPLSASESYSLSFAYWTSALNLTLKKQTNKKKTSCLLMITYATWQKYRVHLKRPPCCGQSLVMVYTDWMCCVFSCPHTTARKWQVLSCLSHVSGTLTIHVSHFLFCSDVLPLGSVRTFLRGSARPLSRGNRNCITNI